MNPFDLIPLIAKYGLSPVLGALAIYFYLEARREERSHKVEYTSLLERYHTQVNEQVHTLALIEEKLDRR